MQATINEYAPTKEEIEFFTQKGLPVPVLVFPMILVDPDYRKETGEPIPFHGTRVGCYAVFDLWTHSVKYVGRATNIRGRLQQHWGITHSPFSRGSKWLDEYFDDSDRKNEAFFPMVAVWFTSRMERLSFEPELISKLSPIFNIVDRNSFEDSRELDKDYEDIFD